MLVMTSGSQSATTSILDWLRLMRGEYAESPGLHLTKKQVQRLWGLDGTTCEALLVALTDGGFLKCTRGGKYIRADSGCS